MADDIKNGQFLIRHGTIERGPLKYKDVEFMVRMKEIPPDAEYRSTQGFEWAPISQLLGQRDRVQDEARGLLPNMTDAIFYFGLFIFFVGAVVYFAVNPFLGDLILIVSLALEIYPVVRSFSKEPKAITKTIGNIIALLWSAFQGLLTIFFIIGSF